MRSRAFSRTQAGPAERPILRRRKWRRHINGTTSYGQSPGARTLKRSRTAMHGIMSAPRPPTSRKDHHLARPTKSAPRLQSGGHRRRQRQAYEPDGCQRYVQFDIEANAPLDDSQLPQSRINRPRSARWRYMKAAAACPITGRLPATVCIHCVQATVNQTAATAQAQDSLFIDWCTDYQGT